jgi:hypothetical protein
VAGDGTDKRLAGARPLRMRPHWWAVLAVSLSLLALVAATTSNRPAPSTRDRAALRTRPARTQPTLPAPTTSSSSLPEPTTTTTTRTTSPVVTAAGTRVGNGITVTPSTAPTSTSTTPAPPPANPEVNASTTQTTQPPASDFVQFGVLQQPTLAAASYTFYGVGSMTVSVTWQFATVLSLTVNCPGGSQTREGPSPLSVVISNAGGGPCGTIVKETVVQYDEVDFKLMIGPTVGT